MRGTRVGLLDDPSPTSYTTCWRCGVRFDYHRQKVGRAAPCRDCREILRDEGDATVWSHRKPKVRRARAA